MFLDRAAILAADDSETATVEVPEWGPPGADPVPTVRVRSLTGDQRSRLFDRARAQDQGQPVPGGWTALCCVMGMIDDKGALLFPNEAEATSLGRKHFEVLERISAKILELSRMTKASREAEAKNSKTPTNSSGTSSPVESTPATV